MLAGMKQHPDTVNPLAVSSIALAASDLELVAGFALNASARLGQSISKSAFVRALIRTHYGRGAQHDVDGEIMREIVGGRVWGTEAASRKPARATASKVPITTKKRLDDPHRRAT